ncbi:MAG: hypothetical protein JW839_07220 [Candidatus Lokiarchaeota archaeon]|nr:hypothetical protein [Candidatus Lokiarchaeota archaeon]
MSLLPEDNDEPISLLPPEEQNAPDPDMFVDGGGSTDYDERKRLAIPKYKHLLPKKVIARQTGAAALVFDILFGLLVYSHIEGHILTAIAPSFDWSQFLNYVVDCFNVLIAKVMFSTRNMIIFALAGFAALLLTCMWGYSDRKVSTCPVCKKKNLKNYNTCSKCDYIFYDREIITREIMSIKLNNLDFKPEDIGNELKERHLADLNPKYIKKVLVKNHFL